MLNIFHLSVCNLCNQTDHVSSASTDTSDIQNERIHELKLISILSLTTTQMDSAVNQWKSPNSELASAASSTSSFSLRFIQSFELLHNFLLTLKLSLYYFRAKSLMAMNLLLQSISKIDQSLAPCWPLFTKKSVSPILGA